MLTSLKTVTLSGNNITGAMPISIGNLRNLYFLRLGDFGTFPHLNFVDLSFNEFYGTLSWKWKDFRNFSTLKVSNNNISGQIPSDLVTATQLQSLDLSSNQFDWPIPKEFGKLKLVYLILNNNQLSGGIPEEIEMLFDLERLDLAANNLSGSIPKQIGGCSKLLFLNLSQNKFTKRIPSEIGNLHSTKP
ncbi:serine-threonine protein kinase, plant-type, putative [Ricinus communis]|uniref:Serine-threonine protein kinase, plant-type, putative n=1 Tax=Ricinus communis TaxID=3988 RepID=B9SIG3_RICCO|nr:serine-threonine protein kinase, plant-type, putative [Ricinus communis]